MFIPDELKLNKFKQVPIPSNEEYFGRANGGRVLPTNLYTGDEEAVMPQNKIDSIIQADAEFRDQLSND